MTYEFVIMEKHENHEGKPEWAIIKGNWACPTYEEAVSQADIYSTMYEFESIRVVEIGHAMPGRCYTENLVKYVVIGAYDKHGNKDDEFLVGHPKLQTLTNQTQYAYIILKKAREDGTDVWFTGNQPGLMTYDEAVSDMRICEQVQSLENHRIVKVSYGSRDLTSNGELRDYQLITAYDIDGNEDTKFLVGHPKQEQKGKE